ncbi:MAG: S9 family peptidase [Acidobacteriota bacterium]|nr:MAG: S9 family peptidase [Acidobacteriota bacterium]
MKKLAVSVALAPFILSGAAAYAQDTMTPPVPRKEAKVTNVHGRTLTDNYHWMRDRNQEKSPEIIAYLEAENRYTDAVMKPHGKFVDSLYEEMLGRIKQTDLSVPYKYGDFWYFTKTIEGKQYPVYLRSKTRDGKDPETLLDQNKMAEGYKFFSIASLRVSDDGKKLAYLIDTTGYRQYVLQVKDLATGETLENRIERVTSVNWASDNNTLFVTTEDEVSKRSDKFWRHDVSANETDLIYEEKDVLFNIYAGRTRDGKYIFLDSNAKTMDEFRYVPADDPKAKPKLLIPREEGHEYSVDHYNGEFYITTNKNAENYRVVKAPIKDPSEKNWKEFIAHDPEVMIEGIDFFKGHAVVSELENGLEYLRVIDMEKGGSKRVETPESVYTMGMAGGNAEFDTRTIMFNYASMITPNSTFEYDLKTGERTLLKQQEVLGGYDSSKYETERVWATARDGVKVPVSIVKKKGVKLDGKAPMLLYAYGSYGYSMTPYFSTTRLSLLDRGMIYAIAHIRGGGELGEKWRQDGRMFKKLNTFYDFIDCSKWLIENKYTSADRLVIQGGSAGGMLMGGVVNMSPETFRAAIVQVPFVDVINTMMDDSLPLTTEEWIEWGNPNEKEAFEYMIKYSPYDNIKAQDYPNLLVMISIQDSQVPYWEGAKFAAKVREMQTGDAQILLKTNMGGGHGGASGRYDQLKETAFVYAYALSQTGISK